MELLPIREACQECHLLQELGWKWGLFFRLLAQILHSTYFYGVPRLTSFFRRIATVLIIKRLKKNESIFPSICPSSGLHWEWGGQTLCPIELIFYSYIYMRAIYLAQNAPVRWLAFLDKILRNNKVAMKCVTRALVNKNLIHLRPEFQGTPIEVQNLYSTSKKDSEQPYEVKSIFHEWSKGRKVGQVCSFKNLFLPSGKLQTMSDLKGILINNYINLQAGSGQINQTLVLSDPTELPFKLTVLTLKHLNDSITAWRNFHKTWSKTSGIDIWIRKYFKSVGLAKDHLKKWSSQAGLKNIHIFC